MAASHRTQPLQLVFSTSCKLYKKLLVKYWWIPLLTLALGEGIQWFLLKRLPPTFVSVGRMIENVKLSIPNANVYSEELNYFFGTQVALMQSDSVIDRVNLICGRGAEMRNIRRPI